MTIGNFVWNDTNGNGVQDARRAGHPGRHADPDRHDRRGAAVTQTTTTDANGLYQFTEPPGTYTVAVTTPAGYVADRHRPGDDGHRQQPQSPSGTTPGTLASGGSDQTIDFGFYQLKANIGAVIEPPHTACSTVVYALTHGLQGQSKVNVHAAKIRTARSAEGSRRRS